MCFSATASFTMGALLHGVGALTVKSARHCREWPSGGMAGTASALPRRMADDAVAAVPGAA